MTNDKCVWRANEGKWFALWCDDLGRESESKRERYYAMRVVTGALECHKRNCTLFSRNAAKKYSEFLWEGVDM